VADPLPPLFTRKELEDRCSPITVQRVLDDYGEGSPSVDAIDQIRADASSRLRGKLGPIINLDALDPLVATEARRIGLDIADAMLAMRHPEVLRKDGVALMKLALKELDDIRTAKADFGTEKGPVLGNDGADVTSGDVNDPEPREHFALSGTGDF
jgi:hypothetical protein